MAAGKYSAGPSYVCIRCQVEKPDSSFASDRGARRGVCRECRSEQENARARARVIREGLKLPASKTCSRCGIDKPSSEFSLRRGRGDNLQMRCKRCASLVQRAAKYGITPDEYEAMEVEQAGLCPICLTVPAESLRVDHDHDTGKVRGLLCHSCNAGMGSLGDDVERLMRAAAYLIEHADVLSMAGGH